LFVFLVVAEDVDYSRGGKEWEEGECANTKEQSPINIKDADAIADSTLQFKLSFTDSTPANIYDNGATIKIEPGVAYDQFSASDTTNHIFSYVPLNFHFHAPAEHKIDGKRHDLELHLVHKMDQASLAGEHGKRILAVVGIFFDVVNDSDADADDFFNTLDLENVNETPSARTLSMKSALANHFKPPVSFYNYEGSLTTPPCSEQVNWYLMKRVLTIGHTNYNAFKSRWAGNLGFAEGHGNYRAEQPLNGRTIKKGKVTTGGFFLKREEAEHVLVQNLDARMNKNH